MELFMCVHRLPVLLQIVDSTEELQTRRTLERLFPRVFSYVTCKMLRPSEGHRTPVVPCALERFPSSTLGSLRRRRRYSAGTTTVKNTASSSVRCGSYLAVFMSYSSRHRSVFDVLV